MSADLVEHALLAEELCHRRAEGRQQHARQAADHNDELHLVRRTRAGTRGRDVYEAAQQLRPEAGVDVLAVDDALLAQGDDLLADAQQVALLIERLDVALDQVDIVLADLDEMRLNGVALIDAGRGLDLDLFGLICNKFHEKMPLSCRMIKCAFIVPQNPQKATVICKKMKIRKSAAFAALFACLLSSLRLRHLPCQMVGVEQMV